MTEDLIFKKVQVMSETLKQEVLGFIDNLLQGEAKTEDTQPKQRLYFGCMKDSIAYISDDFDEPLEEFKDYM